MRPVLHSVKHYVQTSLATVVGSAILNTTLISAKEVADVTAAIDVVEGAIVKAVFVELWCRSGELAAGSFIFIIEKRPGIGSGSSMNVTDMAALQDYENKKNVLYVTQGLTNDVDSVAVPLFRGWIKIPKSKQRFGLKDKLTWSIFAQGAIDLHICGMTTYKEYR